MPLSHMPRTPMTRTTTPGPIPPMRARSDDQELQPSPKKLKSEPEKTPRRPALRDVTNELHPPSTQRHTSAKKQSLSSQEKATGIGKCPEDVGVESNAWETPKKETQADEDVPSETVLDDIASPRPSEENSVVFEYCNGQDEEDELASMLYERLLDQQTRHCVSTNYFQNEVQPHLNAKMRSILVDWLIEVHYRLKLNTETLFLAINYLDRYLTHIVTSRDELQLVGITSLFIAAKFEEVEPVDLADITHVTDKTYTGEQVIAMERKILDVLQFNLSAATTHAFVDYFAHKLGFERAESLLAAYLSQSTLLHLPLLVCYRPVNRAAAAVFLARCIIAGERPSDEWIAQWEVLATHSFDDLLPCIHDLCMIMALPSKKLTALRTKFGTKRFGRVANKSLDNLERFL